MDDKKRKELIDEYKAGYAEVAEAVTGATDEELDRRPAPNKWSAREIVHHLADSEMAAALRLRRLLAENRPEIVASDPDEYAKRLHYDRPVAKSLELFKATRDATAELLDALAPDEWQREGVHSRMGAYTVERWLEIYASHAHKHAVQIIVAKEGRK